ncbi:uncharacterized protein LOC144634629 [Oculina patagonica]
MATISSKTTDDGLDIKCVTLASDLVPSRESVLQYDEQIEHGKAKELLKKRVPNRRTMRPVLGSEENIYSLGNCGLFSAVLTAYNNHWKLRTSPDDWWFCVIKRVACAIDKNAKKESVRKMFVDHEGKKTIEVIVPDTSIYTVDYSWFFDQMATGIQDNVKVPEFVDGMTADFSTTTAVEKIVSQITLMYSVQEYFHYCMEVGCGIPAVEMLGTEDDWRKLKSKLKVLRTLLEPIENDLGLPSWWWDLVEKVFSNLLDTYQGKPDKEWWGHIVSYEKVYMSGFVVDGKYKYKGWIIELLEGHGGGMDIRNMTTGLVSVPLILYDLIRGVKDTATLVAGMLGFTYHEASVQPFQGWALLLSDDSPFR